MTEVLAAIIATVGAITVAVISVRAGGHAKAARNVLGEPNGHGTIARMLEDVIAQQAAHNALDDARFSSLEQKLDEQKGGQP